MQSTLLPKLLLVFRWQQEKLPQRQQQEVPQVLVCVECKCRYLHWSTKREKYNSDHNDLQTTAQFFS